MKPTCSSFPIAGNSYILVPLEESDLESLTLSDNAALNQILTEAEERSQKTGGIKHDDFWRSRLRIKLSLFMEQRSRRCARIGKGDRNKSKLRK